MLLAEPMLPLLEPFHGLLSTKPVLTPEHAIPVPLMHNLRSVRCTTTNV